MNTISRPRPLGAARAANVRRRHDGVCGVWPGAGAYGIGGEDDEGVGEFKKQIFRKSNLIGGGLS